MAQSSKRSARWKSKPPPCQASFNISASGLHNDDSGIFVTCDKGQEAKCRREIDGILSEYVSHHHVGKVPRAVASEARDIEKDIEDELDSMKAPPYGQARQSYTFVKLEIACVSFIRLQPPLDPVILVRELCEDASCSQSRPRSRYIRRLTPVSCMRKTLANGLEQLCELVLRPIFDDPDMGKKVGIFRRYLKSLASRLTDYLFKFAIRPTIRNNDQLDRNLVIKTCAAAVTGMSPRHSVDLTKYDCLILVEVYRNVCGMSVVGPEFERLRRFNLSEIYQAADGDDIPGVSPE